MKIRIRENAKTILSNPHSKHGYFGWPTVIRLQNGSLAVVCSGYRCGHICPFGKLVMATSDDEGDTWTGAFPLIDTPLDDRDGGICAFGETGVMVTSFNNSIAAQRAWNPENAYYNAYLDTLTAADEETYLGSQFRLSFDGGKTFGPIFRSPVTSPHGPTQLHDGTLLWVGRVFSADDSFGENSSVHAYAVHADGHMEFRGAVPAADMGTRVDLCEPHAIELPDGRLLCHIRSERGYDFSTFQTESADGGRTWSTPIPLLPEYGGAPAHLLLHSSGILISAYGYRQPPYGIRLMLSADYGRTWQKDVPLFTDGVSGDLGYPATVELKDGSLLTVFYAKDEPDGPAVIKQIGWQIENE